ncbi:MULTISPECIES: hypothetical protein [unclassified Shinella]|uniref:hypothetical protein n=1 Tax=unclassified Shinella TaxID=2643062 RepID=UPI00234F6A4D|nr:MULTISPECIES: hypothetical protein [unclassified Shinella]MCO5152577.1 hypothetical protein [Shinella sp.]MDC7261872.1 hypothetical protein [Shinella sp. HY16]MDC7268767.1 hypothetical protein [Shinella sp. YZ44]
MTKVTSNHDGPLGLPGGVVLRPGVATNVERWSIIKDHAVVRSWIDAGVLESDEQSDDANLPAPVDEATDTGAVGGDSSAGASPNDDALAKLRAEAKELGIAAHYRWSAEKIQEEIDRKLAE